MEEENPSAEALAVKGAIILEVGKRDEVFALAGNWHSSCILTIGRPFYLHGFIEPHSHTITMAILKSVSEFKSFFKFFSFLVFFYITS